MKYWISVGILAAAALSLIGVVSFQISESREPSSRASSPGFTINATSSSNRRIEGPIAITSIPKLESLIAAALQGRSAAEEIIPLLIQIHEEMMSAATVDDHLGLIASIIRDDKRSPILRFLALQLLGGWDGDLAQDTRLMIVAQGGDELALGSLYSLMMNPVEPGSSENGKSLPAFWVSVLTDISQLFDNRLVPTEGVASSFGMAHDMLFWQCLGVLDDEQGKERAKKILQMSKRTDLRLMALALFSKDDKRPEKMVFVQSVVRDAAQPHEVRSILLFTLASSKPPGWREEFRAIMTGNSDTRLSRKAFSYLARDGIEEIVGAIRSGEAAAFFESTRSAGQLAGLYCDIASLNTTEAPEMLIQLLSREEDISLLASTVKQLAVPSLVERIASSRVRVLHYLVSSPDDVVAEEAADALCGHLEGASISPERRRELIGMSEPAIRIHLSTLSESSPRYARWQALLTRVQALK